MFNAIVIILYRINEKNKIKNKNIDGSGHKHNSYIRQYLVNKTEITQDTYREKIGKKIPKYRKDLTFWAFCYTQNCQLCKTAFTLRPGDKGAGVQADQWALP